MHHFPPVPRKRRTREQMIADLGTNLVERHVLLAGYTVTRVVHDYGFDLLLFTYTSEGETEPGWVYFQVQATDHLKTVRGGRFISCRIERAHLRAWLAEPFPVILTVYDAVMDRVFWLHVQAAFSAVQRFRVVRGSETVTVRIPMEHVLDLSAVRGFRELQHAVVNRLQGAPDE